MVESVTGFRSAVRTDVLAAPFTDAGELCRRVAMRRSPNSLLDQPDRPDGKYIGDGRRLATCGGVAWIGSQAVVTVNLLQQVCHRYSFTPVDGALGVAEPVELAGLGRPENLAPSPDGRLIAVTCCDGEVLVFRVQQPGASIEPAAVARLDDPAAIGPHGVVFSPCGSFLLLSTIGGEGSIRRYAVRDDGGPTIDLVPVQVLPNQLAPLKPKGVAYSPAGDMLVIGYGVNCTAAPGELEGLVDVHEVGPEGRIGRAPVSSTEGRLPFACVEDVNFFPDGRRILLTDQALDSVSVIAIHEPSHTLGDELLRLEPPAGDLSFPHGSAISPDGRHFAVANYGTDTVAVFEL